MDLDSDFHASGLQELLALQRALMEARFYSGALGREIPGSPIVAELHDRCVKAILNTYRDLGQRGPLSRTEQWLQWSGRPRERQALRETLSEMDPWLTWSDEQRLDIAAELVRPFVATDAELASLVNEVTALHRAADA